MTQEAIAINKICPIDYIIYVYICCFAYCPFSSGEKKETTREIFLDQVVNYLFFY